jgi:hypothetical protein
MFVGQPSNLATHSSLHGTAPQVLLSVYSCGANFPAWAALGYTCYEGGHLALAVIAGPAVVLFVTLCALFACVHFDPHPLSPSLTAKAHGERTRAHARSGAKVCVVYLSPRPCVEPNLGLDPNPSPQAA